MNHHATNTNLCPTPFSYSSWSSSSSSSSSAAAESPYALILYALSLIPTWHYLLAYAVVSVTFLYNFLSFHFFQDLFSGFRGCSIGLTYHPSSPIYNDVVSQCKILHGRYLATPWLSNPHFQTCFLNFLGRPPAFRYRRQLFRTADGGTIALDWLMNCDVCRPVTHVNNVISKDDTTPIVVVVPGLTSDSAAAYMKHLAFHTAKQGWNVVVSNHRGLGGVSITSDCFYNAGWTEDVREVICHLHCEYPKAPLFAIGTSIGANVLVKYLGEDGEKTPVAGAVAICNPWDLLIGDRFICRRFVQKLYDKALAAGLQGYAQLHETLFSRLANWEGITKSRSIRDFDNHATCLVGKFETVDTYYRRSSSASYVSNVKVPLLCISALDDPVCTREAIPWDECRANTNIVLATPEHGGHLAFFEGLTAAGLWWVRAVNEYLRVLHSSPYMHEQKTESSGQYSAIESSIDQGPYVNVTADGMVAAVANEQARGDAVKDSQNLTKLRDGDASEILPDAEQVENMKEPKPPETAESSEQCTTILNGECSDVTVPISKCLDQISLFTRRSMWLLALITVTTSWPLIGSAINVIFRNKPRNGAPAALLRR